MKLAPNRETYKKLKELYEAQYGFMPTVLPPLWYYVKILSTNGETRHLKAQFLLDTLKDEGFTGDCEELEESFLILTHYCRLETLSERFNDFIFIPISMMGDNE